MRGPVAIVVELGPLPKSKSVTAQTPSFTLASQGYDDAIFYGTQPQDYTFDFTLPFGWQLAELPFLVLKFTHADILSPDSVIDVALNRVPIGSTLLDDSNISEGELVISLPERLLETGRNRLKVSVEMGLPNIGRCDGLGNRRAWTVISNESEVFLPYNTNDLSPDLSLFPYPFSQNSGFDQTTFVLPDQPSSQAFDELIQLAVRLGSINRTEHLSTQVSYASVPRKIRYWLRLTLTCRSLLSLVVIFWNHWW